MGSWFCQVCGEADGSNWEKCCDCNDYRNRQPVYEVSGLDEFHGPTSLWVDPSLPVLSLFEEEQ